MAGLSRSAYGSFLKFSARTGLIGKVGNGRGAAVRREYSRSLLTGPIQSLHSYFGLS